MVSEFWVYNGNLRGAVAVGYAVLGGGACASLTPAEGTVHPPVRPGRWHPPEGDCLWEERGGRVWMLSCCGLSLSRRANRMWSFKMLGCSGSWYFCFVLPAGGTPIL